MFAANIWCSYLIFGNLLHSFLPTSLAILMASIGCGGCFLGWVSIRLMHFHVNPQQPLFHMNPQVSV